MNLVMVIVVYVLISKEFGILLWFFGKFGVYLSLFEMMDVDLLVKVIIWVVLSEVVWNQVFNIINGDMFWWLVLWFWIVVFFDFEVVLLLLLSFMEVMVDKVEVWVVMV